MEHNITAPKTPTRMPSIAELNADFEEMKKLDWIAIDRQINKDTGIWKRAQQQIGIPHSPETRHKISLALKGRSLPDTTRQKISASLKRFHEKRRGQGETASVPASDSPRL